jgi:hypothetical protein
MENGEQLDVERTSEPLVYQGLKAAAVAPAAGKLLTIS